MKIKTAQQIFEEINEQDEEYDSIIEAMHKYAEQFIDLVEYELRTRSAFSKKLITEEIQKIKEQIK